MVGGQAPPLDFPRLRVARFSGHALTDRIETHRLENIRVRVCSAAKTIADCFRYRNKIGGGPAEVSWMPG